jgi:hypothetical protein
MGGKRDNKEGRCEMNTSVRVSGCKRGGGVPTQMWTRRQSNEGGVGGAGPIQMKM